MLTINLLQAIYQETGRIYKVGTFRDTIYCAAGTSLDWSYGSAQIPFSYLIELRKGEQRFILQETQILDTCKEATVAVESLMKFVDENQKQELKLYQTIDLIQTSNKPCFSKNVHDNSNYWITGSFTSQNGDDPMMFYCKGEKQFIFPETQILETCKEVTVAVKSLMKFENEIQKQELKLNETNDLIHTLNKPCFSNNDHDNSNYWLTGCFTSQNGD